MEKEKIKEIDEKTKLRNKRRKNAKLYPIYKMFSWDLLFFYSIEFLFFIITKKITVSEILIINGFYLFFRIIGQLPAVIIIDFLGKKKSIILGNFLIVLYLLILLFLPGVISVLIANFVFAIGYNIKANAETNLLYDSVSTRGGEGLYSKLDARGGAMYYILDGIASLVAGYLFVINNYIPLLICLAFVVISTVISFGFEEIYKTEEKYKEQFVMRDKLKLFNQDLKNTFKFIFKSKRMKAFILFQMVLYSLISIIDTYKSDLLVNIGIPEEQFSVIFAVMTFIGGISLFLKKSIEKKFKNRTLTFISITYIGACVIIGAVLSINSTKIIIPIILIMYAIQKIMTSIWYILEYKYLKNFTNENNRNKITFTYDFIGGIAASIFSILGGILIKYVNIQNSFLIVGIISGICMLVVLNYMKNRFGLKPEEYKKEDIEF